jgi:hypothetical protein
MSGCYISIYVCKLGLGNKWKYYGFAPLFDVDLHCLETLEEGESKNLSVTFFSKATKAKKKTPPFIDLCYHESAEDEVKWLDLIDWENILL